MKELIRRYLAAPPTQRAFEALMEQTERMLISEALQRTGGNQTHAVRLLGLSRPTLHAKPQRYKRSAGIAPDEQDAP